jgi:hypothetical protein
MRSIRIDFLTLAVVAVATATFLVTPTAQAREPVTPHEAKALEIYRTIISYPTYAGSGKTPEMARYLAGERTGSTSASASKSSTAGWLIGMRC